MDSGRKPTLITGHLVVAITYFGSIFTSNIYNILLFIIIYGIFYAMFDGVQRDFVVDSAPKSRCLQDIKKINIGKFTPIGYLS